MVISVPNECPRLPGIIYVSGSDFPPPFSVILLNLRDHCAPNEDGEI